jgi:hypothetical protein
LFKTFIGIPKGQTANIKKVCEDIKKKDVTFNYSIIKTTSEAVDKDGIKLKDKFENLLVLSSTTLDEANKRGGWFIHKCSNAKLASYFWVKTDDY